MSFLLWGEPGALIAGVGVSFLTVCFLAKTAGRGGQRALLRFGALWVALGRFGSFWGTLG